MGSTEWRRWLSQNRLDIVLLVLTLLTIACWTWAGYLIVMRIAEVLL